MKVLVINAGSFSLKYQLMDPETGKVFAKGLCERIGLDGKFTYKPQVEGKETIKAADVAMPTHSEAIQTVLNALVDPQNGVISSMKRSMRWVTVWSTAARPSPPPCSSTMRC